MRMEKRLPAISLAGGAAAFGASGAVLGAVWSGVPVLLVAIVAALFAGLIAHATANWARPASASLALEERIRQLEEDAATLRHDLRGALSPALMLSERLLRSEDPVICRTGQVVVRSIERAVGLLAEDKDGAVAETAGAADAAERPARSHAAGSGARGL